MVKMSDDVGQSISIPEAGEGKRGADGYLGYLLRQASAAARLALEHTLEDLQVTQPQFLVMTLINAYPGSSGADLARLATVTPQTMSTIVANLERQGRLTRLANPDHARTQRLELTSEGKTLLMECRNRVRSNESRLRASLSADEEQIVRRWLVDVAVQHLRPDPEP